MASEIRVNSITNRSGLGTVTFSDTGVVLSGVSTFSTGIVVAAGSTSAPSISPSGDSNTGIFFPAPDTIAFAEGGVEGFRLDSRSNLGIGTVPQSWSGFRSLQLGGTTSIWSVEGGQSGSSFYSNNIYYDGSNRRYLTSNAASEYIQDASTGNHIFYGVSSGTAGNTLSGYTEFARFTSNGLKLPSGLGIDFSAASNAAGMTSELLDDYEVGTWTPSLNFSGGTTGITYTNRQGYYTKIGNIVYLQFVIVLSNKGSSTGNANVSGVPFGASITSYPNNAGVLVAENNLSSWQLGTYGLVWSDSSIYLRYNGTVNWTPLTETNFTNTSTIYFSTTYRV